MRNNDLKKSLNCQCSLDIGFVCGLFDRASAMFRLSRAARTPLTVEWSLEINHCRTKILFKLFLSFNKHFFMYVLNTNYFHIICTTHSTPHGGTLVLSLMVESVIYLLAAEQLNSRLSAIFQVFCNLVR